VQGQGRLRVGKSVAIERFLLRVKQRAHNALLEHKARVRKAFEQTVIPHPKKGGGVVGKQRLARDRGHRHRLRHLLRTSSRFRSTGTAPPMPLPSLPTPESVASRFATASPPPLPGPGIIYERSLGGENKKPSSASERGECVKGSGK
jgi:hypothetical protein